MLWVVWIDRQRSRMAGEYQEGLTGKRARRPVDAMKRSCGQPRVRNLTTAGPQQSPQDKSQGKACSGSGDSSQDHRLDRVDLGAKRGVVLDALDDLLDRGDHRGVVLAAERSREVGVRVL